LIIMIPLASTHGAFAAFSSPAHRSEALIQSPRDPFGPVETAAARQSSRTEAFLDQGGGFLDIAGAAVGEAVEIGLTVERNNRRVAANDPTGPRRVG
jgi:hypothetical protein